MKTTMSTTISARVPLDVAEMIKRASKKQGISQSAYISNAIVNTPKMAKGGVIDLQMNNVPEEVGGILTVVGGLGAGTIVYQLLKNYLPADKFDKEQIEMIAIGSAIAGGLLTSSLIESVVNKK